MKKELKQGLAEWFGTANRRDEEIKSKLEKLRFFFPLDKNLINERVSKIAIKLLNEKGFFDKNGVGRTSNQARVMKKDVYLKIIEYRNKLGSTLNFMDRLDRQTLSELPMEFNTIVVELNNIVSDYDKSNDNFNVKKNFGQRPFGVVDTYEENGMDTKQVGTLKCYRGYRGNLVLEYKKQMLNYPSVYTGILDMLQEIEGISNKAKEKQKETMDKLIDMTDEQQFMKMLVVESL